MRLFLSICLSTFLLSNTAQNMEQFISYEVPIHMSAIRNISGEITGIRKDIPSTLLEDLTLTNLETSTRLNLVRKIFDKLKKGEISAYYVDIYDYYGPISNESPEKYFQEMIPHGKIDTILSISSFEPVDDLETGMPTYDEFGNPNYENVLSPYIPEEILSLTFYETWSINEKTNIMSKEVKGYTINVAAVDYSGNIIGTNPLCYIPCIDFKTKGKTLVKTIETKTTIKQELILDYNQVEIVNSRWWENTLLPEMRNFFLGKNEFAPFASPGKPLELYLSDFKINITSDFPYTHKVSFEEAKLNSAETFTEAAIDMNTGMPKYDDKNNPIYEDFITPYKESDIIYLEFIEEWFFDEETLSIQKKIKGISPAVNAVYNGEIVGWKSLFWIRYQ